MTNSKEASEKRESIIHLINSNIDDLNKLTRLVEYYRTDTNKELAHYYKYIKYLTLAFVTISVPLVGAFLIKMVDYV